MASDGEDTHPRKRPTLADKQRSQIDRLMRNIDKPIDISGPAKAAPRAPPEIVLNVRGSSAGAGSSDFSIYRDLRRKENQRLRLMEAEAAQDAAQERFAREAEALRRRDEDRTAKNRAKRQKRKTKSAKHAPASQSDPGRLDPERPDPSQPDPGRPDPGRPESDAEKTAPA
ncbi:PRKR-interacting protein 1 [Coemansia javaensis]|uniref:PRKR-interacting protein 1 n=1 Tax=Coemansia javaensis TaxID=2761396 RepID=A0A9W8HGG7_9FUNG|nr:PRKR-interacting protein 1 [Coemansia javaensis]